VKFENRLIGNTGDVCLITVDGTDFEIWEPRPYNKEENKIWFSSKFKSAGVRYEIGICIKTGHIVWINGPYPCGWGCDLKIFKQKLATLLLPYEKVMCDRNYRDYPHQCYCKSHVQKYIDPNAIVKEKTPEYQAIARATARHEDINGRFKEWGILDQVYRNDRDLHYIFFNAIAVVTQIEILNNRPAWSASGPGAHYVQPISTPIP
jgi:hypothetical protein